MQIADAVDEYLFARRRLAPITRTWYGNKLKPFVAWCATQSITDVDHLKTTHIRKYQDYRSTYLNPRTGKPLSSSSLHSDAIAIKAWLTFCHEEEITASNQGKRIEVPKIDSNVIEVFSPRQIQALLTATSKGSTPALAARDRAIVSVLIDTGIRASELCGLVLENVFLGRDDCFIRVMGKGRREREIGFGNQTSSALRRYITCWRKAPKEETHVFVSSTGKPLTRNGLDQMLSRLGEHAQITGVRVSAHTFRHSYAVRSLLSRIDVYKLSRLMGHSSVQITETYLQAVKSYQARQDHFSVLDTIEQS